LQLPCVLEIRARGLSASDAKAQVSCGSALDLRAPNASTERHQTTRRARTDRHFRVRGGDPNGQSVRVFESVPARVVAAILRRDNRLLLCHRHPERAWYPDVWDLPGGHVEHGETPTEALARELREELAVDLQSPLGLPFEEVADSVAAVNMTIWLIDYAGTVVNHAPDEHDELRWVTSDEIADLALAHPSYVELLGRAVHA
jgi:8-oxo-dGTP diphosphatase